ncbi:TolB family protein [Kamptonema formosum]|uniref:TolB family protein n=1 Tax=Kamptonema formosum TaxID=331992 RepID=UPI00034B6B42|nr:PD40 domain-containing protein [Oscillatoria sp. PCC 10802]
MLFACGGNPANITNSPGEDSSPARSPDGKQIAFYSNRDGNYESYLIGAGSSNVTRLTDCPAFDISLNWEPAQRGL